MYVQCRAEWVDVSWSANGYPLSLFTTTRDYSFSMPLLGNLGIHQKHKDFQNFFPQILDKKSNICHWVRSNQVEKYLALRHFAWTPRCSWIIHRSLTEYFSSGAFTQSTKPMVHLFTSPPYFPITAASNPLEQAETNILLQNDDLF